jgi:hypothetical protein
VVIADEQYATRLVLPSSQRRHRSSWSSHKDLAAKALRKLAGPHPPASLTKLEQAIKPAHNAHTKRHEAALARDSGPIPAHRVDDRGVLLDVNCRLTREQKGAGRVRRGRDHPSACTRSRPAAPAR